MRKLRAHFDNLLQHSRFSLLAASLLIVPLFAGCGGGGGTSSSAITQSPPPLATSVTRNSFSVTADDYGLQSATYLAATRSDSSVVLRAAIASSMTDPSFRTVIRVTVSEPAKVTPGTYSLGGDTTAPLFPGEVYVFNGHPSTLLKVRGGTISFTAFGPQASDAITGSMTLVIEDDFSTRTPKPTYTCKADFSFILDSYGPSATTAPAMGGAQLYDSMCTSCHRLGSYDADGSAPDLSLRGGELNGLFSAGVPGHKGLTLGAADIWALQVFLNAN